MIKKENPEMAATIYPGTDQNKLPQHDNPTCLDDKSKDEQVTELIKIFRLDWWKDFEVLATKYANLGFGQDIPGMTILELWGLYQWLKGFE